MTRYVCNALIAAAMAVCGFAAAQPVNDQFIPREAKAALDRLHPGWKLAAISNDDRRICFRKESSFQPALVWGDFNGDGKKDYAALVEYGGKTGVVILLAGGQGYKPVEVFKTTKPGERAPSLLDVVPKGMPAGSYRRKLPQETVMMQYCESSSVIFVYANGSFRQVVTED